MYWIVNLKSKKYCEVKDQPHLFDGEWKDRYPHLSNADWLYVASYHIDQHDTANGIPFVYDLSQNGGHFLLLVDTAMYSKRDIDQAKNKLWATHDVVTLRVSRLTRVDAPQKPAADPPPKSGNWPMPGHAVRLKKEFMGVEQGSIGIIGGCVGVRKNDYEITFNPSTFMDEKVVSCSGGPGTISTPATEFRETEDTIEITVWKWKNGYPAAGGGEYYKVTVPIWDWY